jgi:ribose 5-phosphate isomerase B
MRVAVGFDHAGVSLRETVVALLELGGHAVIDCGTDSEGSVDYPLHAGRAATLVSDGDADRAVLACGSGTGVCIVANKFTGVRAVNARDVNEIEMARRHNDVNVLTLAGRGLDTEQATQIVRAFFGTSFEGGRHARRVQQIAEIEAGELIVETPPPITEPAT